MAAREGERAHRGLEDRIDAAWVWDRIAKVVIFIGGISAIIFVISIFVFVAKEGLGFALFDLDKSVFFGSPAWRPTSEPEPQFGALALIAFTRVPYAPDAMRLGSGSSMG